MSDDKQPAWARHLRWLLFALGTLLLALGLIAVAGVVLKEGMVAEIMALAGVAIAIPAMTVGIIALNFASQGLCCLVPSFCFSCSSI